MEKLEFGETAVLENGKEYVCYARILEDGIDYVYLVTNSKPLEVRFAKQVLNNGELTLEIIEDQELKLHLLDLFKEQKGNIKNI